MSSLRNLKGQRFGRLAVLRRIRILKRKAYPAQWHCLCDCGNNRIITSSSLVRGLSQSCGCLRSELSSARAVKNLSRTYPRLIHGHARKRDKSRTYSTWLAMIQRCYYPKNVGYKNYGARGITVCNRWRKSFEAFLEDMGERPAGKTIDRWPDPAGNYEPGNTRWATPKEQANNRRVKQPHGQSLYR